MHTPGPWYVYETGVSSQHGPLVSIDANPLKIVANPDWHGDHEEYMANARLIAAAPDLLAACKAAYDLLAVTDSVYEDAGWAASGRGTKQQLDAAIARAEGRE